MIYAYPEASEPIRQGDIFRWLPRPELVLRSDSLPLVLELADAGSREVDWLTFAPSGERVLTNVLLKPVTGIVITQDCDALRTEHIAVCEVRPFAAVERRLNDKTQAKGFVSIVTQHARVNQKWYYLPPEEKMGFGKMGVDFTSVFEVPRVMLEQHRATLRLGRLNSEVAWPHFRERVAEFFRRYPYNEWYPLTSDEVDLYERDNGPVERYSWQLSGLGRPSD